MNWRSMTTVAALAGGILLEQEQEILEAFSRFAPCFLNGETRRLGLRWNADGGILEGVESMTTTGRPPFPTCIRSTSLTGVCQATDA